MTDMSATLTSCSFRVKDIVAFKAWFAGYHFGEGVELYVDAHGYVTLAGEESCAYPRRKTEEDDVEQVEDLKAFALELCAHLEDDELVNIVACGNEGYRYAFYDQLIIAKSHPNHPLYRCGTSDLDYEGCLRLIEAESAAVNN